MGRSMRGYGSVQVQRAVNREKAVAVYIEHRTKETGVVDEEILKIQIEAFRNGWNASENKQKQYRPTEKIIVNGNSIIGLKE